MKAKDIGLFPFKDLGTESNRWKKFFFILWIWKSFSSLPLTDPNKSSPYSDDLSLLSESDLLFSQGMDFEIKPQQDA
jgi:hypothetical protein